jgi:hypothetical protein
MTDTNDDYEKAVKLIGKHKLIYYYPIELHYGKGMGVGCDIGLQGCINMIGTKRAAFAFNGNLTGSGDDSGKDMCIICFNKMVATGYEPIFPPITERQYPFLFQLPNHVHVINFGSPTIKEQVCCLRCKKSSSGPVLESSQGSLCFHCVNVLTSCLLPLK